jgi:uncharacterized protein YegP (UPF0339 family)
MLLIAFTANDVLLYCVIAGVIVIAAVCIYFYYRISKRADAEMPDAGEDNAESGDDIDEISAAFPQYAADNIITMSAAKKEEKPAPQEKVCADEGVKDFEEQAEEPPQTQPETIPEEYIPEQPAEETIETAETVEPAETTETPENVFTNDKGESIEISEEDGGFVFTLKSAKGEVLGKSGVYQTRPGLVKSFKSFANYKDTKVYDITITANDFKITKFELFAGDDGKYCYHLKTKNSKIKFSGCGFKSKSQCLSAIDKVKNICDSFAIEQ